MQELGELVLASDGPLQDQALKAVLVAKAKELWSGWGHTHMIEDGNRELRNRESHDTNNKVLKVAKQWDVLRSRDLVQAYRRVEVQADPADPALADPEPVTKALFEATDQEVTIDALHITDRADWASFSAQTAMSLSANRALLSHCSDKDCWEDAANSWMCLFLPPGLVLLKGLKYYLSLGPVGYQAAMLLEIEPVTASTGDELFFSLAKVVPQTSVTWEV
eukprot:2227447-Lingulodinium_polyedra.AAC.2